MSTRFRTDPRAMGEMAGRFEVRARPWRTRRRKASHDERQKQARSGS